MTVTHTPGALKSSVDADTIVTVHAADRMEELAEVLGKVDGVASAATAAGAVQVKLRGSSRGLLPRIITAADAAGIDVEDLSVAEPTLETVFINLTGKELRD